MIEEKFLYKTRWIIRRYADDAAFAAGQASTVVGGDGQVLPAESIINGNMLLNEGIGELLDLLCGLGTPTAFNNANARMGIGDSTTAEAAGQTGLQAATNKAYAAMEAGYPQRSGQTVTFRSVFAGGVANHAWREFTIVNAAGDTGKNLNRKTSDQGTKAAGQIWTMEVSLTIS